MAKLDESKGWKKITTDIKKEVDASNYNHKFVMDPKGFLLIRINKKDKLLEVGFCTNKFRLTKVIRGKTPEEVMYKTVDSKYISMMDHAAYLGKELQKAYIAMKHPGFEYIQDSPLRKKK